MWKGGGLRHEDPFGYGVQLFGAGRVCKDVVSFGLGHTICIVGGARNKQYSMDAGIGDLFAATVTNLMDGAHGLIHEVRPMDIAVAAGNHGKGESK